MSVAVNNPKNKLSQFASTTVMDNNGIQFLKIREDEKYSVTKSLHTSTTSDVKLPFTATTTYSPGAPSNCLSSWAHADPSGFATDIHCPVAGLHVPVS